MPCGSVLLTAPPVRPETRNLGKSESSPGNTSKRYPDELKARAVRMSHGCRSQVSHGLAAKSHVATRWVPV